MSVKKSNEDFKAHSVDMHTQLHRGVEGLQSLRKQWEELHRYCDLWSRFEWYHAYATNLSVDSENIYFIQIIAGDETVAIIPAEITKQRIGPFGSLNVLCLAFHPHIFLTDFPLNPHVDPTMVSKQMMKAFLRLPVRWDVVQWPRIMHSSNAMRVTRSISGYSVHIRQATQSNSIDTRKSFEELFNTFSKNLRTHLKKSRKRLTDIDNWHVKSDNEDIWQSYNDFLRLESSGWKGGSGAGSAIGLNDGTRGFYATLLGNRSSNFLPEITLLICGSHPIAGQFTIWTQGCKYIQKIGYDEDYSKIAPGQILLEEVLRSACTSTSTERVSLISNSPWHQQWHPTQDETFDVMVFRHRSYGIVMGWYLSARKIAKFFITTVKERF